MNYLYCDKCNHYHRVDPHTNVEYPCGWEQPLPVGGECPDEDDHYSCSRCGDVYHFINAYDHYTNNDGVVVYLIDGWYGECDNTEMCSSCWDDT